MTSTSSSAPLAGPQRFASHRMDSHFFIPHTGIINCPVKEHLEHLQQLQLAHDLDRPVHHRFALEKLPEIFLREDNSLNDFAERNSLVSPPFPDLLVALLDIQFVLAQQPLAQMAVNLVNPLP